MFDQRIPGLIIAAVAVTLISTLCRGPAAALDSIALVTYQVGARPRAIAIADLDGDGRRDVLVANSAVSTVTVLLGAKGGQLRRSPSPIPAGQEPSDIDAADLDKDGHVDLAVANHETSRVTVLLNNGSARFTPAPGSPFDTGARPHVHGLATGDFDGDGWVDVAVDSADTKEVRVLRGSSRGLGAAVAISVGTMPYFRVGAADVTGDSHADVLVPGHSDNTVRVVHYKGGRLVLAAWTIQLADKPWMVVGDDVNGDRRNDIIVVQSSAASVWLSGPDGFSPAPGSPFAVTGATEVATGDLDGDRVADVAVGPWDGDEVTVLTGPKLTQRTVRTCERPIGLAIADLDGDRRGELLATCATQNRLVVVSLPPGR